MQSSVKTVLHKTSVTKLDNNMRKTTRLDMSVLLGRKEYIWTLTMCTVFQLITNLCKIMWDSKHRAITQTIHWHESYLASLFCDAG